jgi:5-methylcytosine-specific restriction endonuclease McrA
MAYRMMPSASRRSRKRNLIRRNGAKCVACGRSFPAEKLTLDHIVPASKGGTHALSNLQLMCEPCNQRKGARVPKKIEVHPWHPERLDSRGRAVAA